MWNVWQCANVLAVCSVEMPRHFINRKTRHPRVFCSSIKQTAALLESVPIVIKVFFILINLHPQTHILLTQRAAD